MEICEYGCNQKAKYQFKNGKWCCSKNHKQCPGIIYTPPKFIPKVKCPHCNKEISKNSIKRHIKSCISFNICLQCGKKTKNPKFCGAICSAKYNNKNSKKLRKFQNKKIEKGGNAYEKRSSNQKTIIIFSTNDKH
jgi:hypothetical protein